MRFDRLIIRYRNKITDKTWDAQIADTINGDKIIEAPQPDEKKWQFVSC